MLWLVAWYKESHGLFVRASPNKDYLILRFLMTDEEIAGSVMKVDVDV